MIQPIEEKLKYLQDFTIDFEGPKHPNLKAILVPHAGLAYSGKVAQLVYQQVDWAKYNKIILLSTHHNSGNFLPEDQDFVLDGNTFKLYDLDLKIGKKDNNKFNKEHSWLVQMPFLSNNLPITIILVGTYDELLVDMINDKIDDKTFVIVNTDLLHCGRSFDVECPLNIKEYNESTVEQIMKLSNLDELDDHVVRLCGEQVVKLFIEIAKKRDWQSITSYYNSSDKTYLSGTTSRYDLTDEPNKHFSSVGYASILFNNNKELLKIPRTIMEWEPVRKKLGSAINEDEIIKLVDEFMEKTQLVQINQKYGIFVTIENESEPNKLRGCIGQFTPENVGKLIAKQTLISAFKDTRFRKNMITESELPQLSYKINFLGTPEEKSIEDILTQIKIADIKTIPIEGHGITLYFEEQKSATYLASVLPELGISKNNIEEKWKSLENSLRKKAKAKDQVEKIEIYYCQEFSEQNILKLEQEGGNLLKYKINYNFKYL